MKIWVADISFGGTEYFCGIYSSEEKARQAAITASRHVNDPCHDYMKIGFYEAQLDADPLGYIPHHKEPRESYYDRTKDRPLHPIMQQYLDMQKNGNV